MDKAIRLFTSVMRAAVDSEIIIRNPALRLSLPTIEPKAKRYLADDGESLLLDELDEPYRTVRRTPTMITCLNVSTPSLLCGPK